MHRAKCLTRASLGEAAVYLAQSLFESALSRTYANSAVSVLSLEQALACKTGCPLLAQSLSARFRQPRRQGFLGQAIEIPHSNRLSECPDPAAQELEGLHEGAFLFDVGTLDGSR